MGKRFCHFSIHTKFKCSFFLSQPLAPPTAQSMDYADADYRDLYDYGPVSYRIKDNKNKAESNSNTSAADDDENKSKNTN